eukprot:gb/GEZN01006204.1/.p1 GENE.gb/GEZN01006204.1/~~gb/GEZN01006204.1/.p1  ORF type:complete len:511 (-),score=122.90 gb/GEZN01006204.1/:49-1581(-)
MAWDSGFGHDPLAAQINRITDGRKGAVDWAGIMEVCDKVNQTPSLGGDVLRNLRPRLSGKDHASALHAIEMLNCLMKNCPKFHPHCGNKEFLSFFVKTLPSKIRDPFSMGAKFKALSGADALDEVQEKRVEQTLILIMTWGKAFSKSLSYPIFYDVFKGLEDKGVMFPVVKEDLAPIFTPSARSDEKQKPQPYVAKPKQQVSSPTKPKAEGSPPASHNRAFSDPQCITAHENARVFCDMVTSTTVDTNLARDEILQTLLGTVRDSQATLNARIQKEMIAPTAALEELLLANDELAEALQYYEGVRSGKIARRKNTTTEETEEAPKKKKKKKKKEAEAFSDKEEVETKKTKNKNKKKAEKVEVESEDSEEELPASRKPNPSAEPHSMFALAPPKEDSDEENEELTRRTAALRLEVKKKKKTKALGKGEQETKLVERSEPSSEKLTRAPNDDPFAELMGDETPKPTKAKKKKKEKGVAPVEPELEVVPKEKKKKKKKKDVLEDDPFAELAFG